MSSRRPRDSSSTIGFVAFATWPDGPSDPRLEKAHADGLDMRFWVRYPRVEPGGRVTWRTKKTIIHRYLDQLEFEW